MANNARKRFTVQLDVEPKVSTSQVQAVLKNLGAIFSDFQKKSEKMTYFQELVDYLHQIDSELTRLKKIHGAKAVNKAFGGLGESIQKQLQEGLMMNGQDFSQFDVLRKKINDVVQSGGKITELVPIIREINTFLDLLGRSDMHLDTDIGGDVRAQADTINQALDEVVESFNLVRRNITVGLSGSGNGPSFDISNMEETALTYDKLREKILALDKAIKQYDKGLEIDGDGISLEDKIDELNEYIVNLDKTGEKAELINQILGDLQFHDIDENQALMHLCDILQVDLPKGIVKFQEFMKIAEQFRDFNYISKEDSDTGIQKLEAMKAELVDLAKQGDITADQLDQVNTVFNTAITNLKKMDHDSHKGPGMGDGSGLGTGTAADSVEHIGTVDVDFTRLENAISSEAKRIVDKLNQTLDVNVVSDMTKISSAVNEVKGLVEKISSEIDAYKASQATDARQVEIDAMKQNLSKLLTQTSNLNNKTDLYGNPQKQEMSAQFMSNGSIATSYGEKGSVPWNRVIAQLVKNLNSDLVMDVHSHPFSSNYKLSDKYFSDFFSGSKGDLSAWRKSKNFGAQLSGMIAGNILRTFDISKLDKNQYEKFITNLNKIELEYSKDSIYGKYVSRENDGSTKYYIPDSLEKMHMTSKVFEEMMYKALKGVGFSQDQIDEEIFKKYDLTNDEQLTQLAAKLVDLNTSAQSTIAPVQRLSDILQVLGVNTASSEVTTALLGFEKGEIPAVDVINRFGPDWSHISEDLVNSVQTIDYNKEPSIVESTLNGILDILTTINTTINNIQTNIKPNASSEYSNTIDDVLRITHGAGLDNITSGAKSIYDSKNISKYQNDAVIKIAKNSVGEFLMDVLDASERVKDGDKIELSEVDKLITSFKTSVANVEDALRQVMLYESSAKEKALTNIDGQEEKATDYLQNLKKSLLDIDEAINPLLQILKNARDEIRLSEDQYDIGTVKTSQATSGNSSVKYNSNISEISQEKREIEELIRFLNQVKVAVDAKTLSFEKEGNVVQSVVQSEENQLDILESRLDKVTIAIDNNTDAFVSGKTTVDSIIDAEINKLNELCKKLIEVKLSISEVSQLYGKQTAGATAPEVKPTVNNEVDNIQKKAEAYDKLIERIKDLINLSKKAKNTDMRLLPNYNERGQLQTNGTIGSRNIVDNHASKSLVRKVLDLYNSAKDIGSDNTVELYMKDLITCVATYKNLDDARDIFKKNELNIWEEVINRINAAKEAKEAYDKYNARNDRVLLDAAKLGDVRDKTVTLGDVWKFDKVVDTGDLDKILGYLEKKFQLKAPEMTADINANISDGLQPVNQENVVELDALKQKALEVKNAINEQTEAFEREKSMVNTFVDAEVTNIETLRQKLIDVTNAVEAKTRAFEEEYVTVDAAINAEMIQLNALLGLLKQITAQIGILNDGFSNTGKNTITSGGTITVNHEMSKEYALDTTLHETNSILDNILVAINNNEPMRIMTGALSVAIQSLKDVANGIVQHQKSQRSDTSVAMARIQDSKKLTYMSGLAKDSIEGLGTDAEIESYQALTNGLVKFEGVFKNAQGQWEGFTVKINEHNEAVDLAIKKHSALANKLNNTGSLDDNPIIYTKKEDVEARAQRHLDEYSAQGKNATVQFKDSGRYTITILEEIDGLTKKIFQTFDENDKMIERTTVTMSNAQKTKLENLQKKLIDDGIDNGLIGDEDETYNKYQEAAEALMLLTEQYSKQDELSDKDIANWKQQIALVQQLGDETVNLIQQRKEAQKADHTVFSKMKEKKKNIGKYQTELAGLDKKSEEDIPVINEIKKTLVILNNEYDALEKQLKKPLSTEQLKELSEIAEKTADDIRLARAKMEGTIAAKNKKDIKKADDDAAKRSQKEINNAFAEMKNKKKTIGALEVELAKLDNNSEKDAPIIKGITSILNRLKNEYTELESGFGEFLSTEQVKELGDVAQKTADNIRIVKAELEGVAAAKNKKDAIKHGDDLAKESQKEIDVAFNQMVSKKKSIGSFEATLAQLDAKSIKDAPIVKVIQNIIDRLNDEYNKLNEEFGGFLSKEQTDQLTAIVQKNTDETNIAKAKKEGADAKKKEKQKKADQKKLKTSYDKEADAFNEYKKGIQNADYLTEGLKTKIEDLGKQLQEVKTSADLSAWQEEFKKLSHEIDVAKNKWVGIKNSDKAGYKKQADDAINGLGFDKSDSDLSDEQRKILQAYDNVIIAVREYESNVASGNKAEVNGIREAVKALKEKTDAYRKANDIANVNTKNFGATAMRREATRYGRLNNIATTENNGYSESPKFLEKFNEYKNKYEELVNLQRQFANSDVLTNEQVAQWDKLKDAVANMGKELEKSWRASEKLSDSGNWFLLGSDFIDDESGRKRALTDFVKQLSDVDKETIKFKKDYNECSFVVKNSDGTFTKMTTKLDAFKNQIVSTADSTERSTSILGNFFGDLKDKARNIVAYLISITGIEEIFQQVRQGIQYVREIDAALTELKKVTNETDVEYTAFLQSMSKTASVVGSTVSELTTIAAEWARLGYSMEEAGRLAESTAILLNVSEFEDATTASEALISTMQAFEYTADESMHVVDILNEVGNNYAISSDGLAIALQDSASALMEAGNNLEESVALIAAANKVVQDPNSVGSALRTISLRLRGTSVSVLQEMGEETDGVVESVSKMQEKIEALTGVNILTESGSYKDTYEILREIGKVWEDMSDIDQAALLELMAGKNRANTLAAILGNMEDLEGAYESALNAEGSALKENEAYLDSIQGRIDIFVNSVQTMWMNFLDSDVVKWFVDLGTAIVNFADKFGLISTLAGTLLPLKSVIGDIKASFEEINDDPSKVLQIFKTNAEDATNATDDLTKSTIEATAADKAESAANIENATTQNVETASTEAGTAATLKDTIATKANVIATKALAAAKSIGKGLLIGLAITAVTNVFTSIINSAKEAAERMKELTDAAIDSAEELNNTRDSVEDYKSEIESLRKTLEDSTATEQEAYDARANLINIQNDLIDKFGLEAEGINLVTGEINAQIAAIDKLIQKNAEDWYGNKDNQTAYQNAINEMKKTHNSNDFVFATETGTYTDNYNSYTKMHDYQYQMSGRTLGSYSDSIREAYNNGLKEIIESAGGEIEEILNRTSSYNLNRYEKTWKASFNGKTAEELNVIFDEMQTFLIQFEADHGVKLSTQLQDLDKARKKYIDEDYQKAKELYDTGRQQEAYAKYAVQYGDILDAEEEFYKAKTDKDRLTKIEEYNQAVKTAFEKAGGGFDEYGNWAIDPDSVNVHMQEYFADMQDKFNAQEFELKVKISKDDENGLQSQLEEIIQKGGESGLSSLDDNQIKELAKGSYSQSTAGYYIDHDGLGYTQAQIEGIMALQNQADAAGISVESLIDILVNLGLIAGRPVDGAADSVGAVGKAYSELSESVEKYASIDSVLAEVTADNVKLTQEQGEALKELIGSEEEYTDCIDESNGYIVKNSALLRKLVAQKKQDQKATIRQAKSNAQLQYKNTVQQLQQVIKAMALEAKATGLVSNGTLNTIGVLREQLTTLKQTIQQYALLEISLSDAANAYSEFEAAKQRDAQLTYGDSMIEMLQAINEGFKTGKVGTEAFQFAVEAIVPPEVYQNIDDIEARMIAIHDYIDKNPIFADWFTIDDGEFSITLDNINNFIDDAFAKGLFTNDSSGDFFLSSNFISNSDQEKIDSLNKTLKEFQDTYNGTVDLINRKRIDITEENIDIVHGWGGNMADVEVGDYMTVASQTYQNGNAAIVVTPILPNGELMEQDELDAYIDDVIAKTNAGSGNYSDYDTKGILMGVFNDENTWEANLAASDDFVNRVHEIHEVINSLGNSPTLKDFADALGVTESAALAMLTELEKYDASWGNIISDLTTAPLDRKIIDATDALDEALIAQEEFIRNGGDLNSEEYQKLVENVNSAQTALNDATTAAELNAQKYNQIETAYAALTGEIKLTKDAADSLFKSLGFVDENGNVTVQVNDDGTIHMTEEQLIALKGKADEISSNPTVIDMQFRYDTIDAQIAELQRYVDEDLNFKDSEIAVALEIENEEQAKAKIAELTAEQETISLNYNITATTAEQTSGTLEKLTTWETEGLNINISGDTAQLQEAVQEANALTVDDKEPKIIIQGVPVAISQIDAVIDELDKLKDESIDISINKTTYEKTKKWNSKTQTWEPMVNGTAHAGGTANASGDWGAPKTEVALTGELGPEMIVRGNRWFTVGDNGAEFTQVKKGDIIFNHKQTEDLLSKGYVTSRGKMTGNAFASGTAYYKTFGGYTGDEDVFKNGSDKWMDVYTNTSSDLSDAADKISSAADSISDSADEFHEVFDWVEVRLEEIDEDLNLLSAQLENASNYSAKNNIVDNMIGVNQVKIENLVAGIEEYSEYASKLLNEVPAKFREAAQNGEIAITDFAGEANEATVEAISNYREWAQKVADLKQQLEEVKTEIKDLARQKFDNIYEAGDVRATVEDSQTEKLQNAVDLIEESGKIATEEYYNAMMENSNKTIEYLTKTRDEMQKVFNEAVEAGIIVRGSNEWYEMIDQLYQIDAEIDGATKELEEFQNAINDIYWSNFDQLINRLDYLKDETQNLIDLMDDVDLVDDNGDWTDEGLASLGLYAQQMEIAEYQSKQYAEAIDDLTADYDAGLYSENEYMEKLAELKDAQYDSIEAYDEAKKAIVDLNKTRIDAIKEGIEEEIDAYEELINKKKEALDAEKDLYDFQKGVADQQKTIAEIERQLAALANDNSLSAAAKRKQLEAELAEAQYELQDTYYNRSVEDKQSALDKELEDFKTEKEAEIEAWDEYLENIELVVAESLGVIQANASGIYDTLMEKANEYDLTVSDAIMTPWQDGTFAVSDYQEQFDTAMSSTMNQLEALKNKWQEVIDKMLEASRAEVSGIHSENNNYASAEKKPEQAPSAPPASNNKPKEEKTIKVGGKINASGAKIYSSIGSKGQNQYYSKDPVYVVLEEKSGYLKVRHHSAKSGVTGWFKKSDVKAYAKGSSGVSKDQWALIDELGEELQIVPGQNGRLEYIKKGTAIIPSDLTNRLVDLAMNPQEMLDRNRPSINVSPSIVTNTIEVNMSIAEVVHIDKVDNDTIPDLTKAVRKEMDSYMGKLNNAIKSKVR